MANERPEREAILDRASCDLVNRAVREAERRTRAEIVPVVARASSRYERAEDIAGLWGAALALALAWLLFQRPIPEGSGWSAEPALGLPLWGAYLALAGGFLLGVIAAGRLPGLRRLFVPPRELERRAIERAKSLFFDRRLHRTEGRTGVLLYLSLFERVAVVLADDAVVSALSARALDEVRDEIVRAAREGGAGRGLVAGIERLAALLEPVLHAGEGDTDELASEIVLIESFE